MSKAWNKRIKNYTPEQIAWRFRSRDKLRPNLAFPFVHKDEARIWATDGRAIVYLQRRCPGHAGRRIDDHGRIIIFEGLIPDESQSQFGKRAPTTLFSLDIAELDGIERGRLEVEMPSGALRLSAGVGMHQRRRGTFDAELVARIALAMRDLGARSCSIELEEANGPARITSTDLGDAFEVFVMPLNAV